MAMASGLPITASVSSVWAASSSGVDVADMVGVSGSVGVRVLVVVAVEDTSPSVESVAVEVSVPMSDELATAGAPSIVMGWISEELPLTGLPVPLASNVGSEEVGTDSLVVAPEVLSAMATDGRLELEVFSVVDGGAVSGLGVLCAGGVEFSAGATSLTGEAGAASTSVVSVEGVVTPGISSAFTGNTGERKKKSAKNKLMNCANRPTKSPLKGSGGGSGSRRKGKRTSRVECLIAGVAAFVAVRFPPHARSSTYPAR